MAACDNRYFVGRHYSLLKVTWRYGLFSCISHSLVFNQPCCPTWCVVFNTLTKCQWWGVLTSALLLARVSRLVAGDMSRYDAHVTAMWTGCIRLLGTVSISDKTSYRKISWSLDAARLVFGIVWSLWKLTGTSAALPPRSLSNFRAILWFKLPISRLRDFTRSYDKTSYRILKWGPGRGPSYIWLSFQISLISAHESHILYYNTCHIAAYVSHL